MAYLLHGVTAYAYSIGKDQWLKKQRGFGFEAIIALLEAGKLQGAMEHPNQARYPGQYVLEMDIAGYTVIVPCKKEKEVLFLKTAYFSRKANRRRKGGK